MNERTHHSDRPAGALLLVGLLTIAGVEAADAQVPPPRLYVLDCGTLVGRNLAPYDLPNEARDMSVSCALIVHPQGTLLWETGLGDRLFTEGASDPRGYHVDETLGSQLAGIGYGPHDITFLAMSHMHADHTGNANAYMGSVWLVQRPELDVVFEEGRDASTYDALRTSEKIVLDGDHDVFGDGTVVLLSTPGHTPGHQSLFVALEETGGVVLSGDLYHYPEERTFGRLPTFEFDMEKTAASRARVEEFLLDTGALLWIQHDIIGYTALNKAPAHYR